MLTLLHEVHFWTQKDAITIKDSDFGAFKYYDKKLLPQGLFFEGKKTYMLERGLMPILSNKRPLRLRDALKELEEILCHNRIVVSEWRSTEHIYIVIGSGLKINIRINTEVADIEEIYFDKYMIGKLSSQYLSHVGVCDNQAIFTYTDNEVTLINFLKPSSKYDNEKKWSNLDPKLQVAELRGPAGRRVDRQVSYNTQADLVLVWWKCSNDEVYPWSPSVRDEDRANVHVYSINLSKLDLRCFFRTEYDPVYIAFSAVNAEVIHSVQQRVSDIGEVTLEWSIIEMNHGKLDTSYIISLLLPTHSCVVALSPKEDRLFIGCIDGSILIADNSNVISDIKKAYFIPSLASWHPDSSLILISNERGQMQWFDRALFCVKSQFLNEESTPTTILDLSSYFRYQPTLLSTSWNRKTSGCKGRDDIILLRFERGPLVGIKLCCGMLTPDVVISQYLSTNCADRAVSILLTLDWAEEGDLALSCLQAIVSHLLRFQLTPDRESLLERALGSYHSPQRPIPESVLDEVADSVHDLSRRFFHHLLRYQICDKAFSLAIDLDDYDLFMDLHNYGKITGNAELALAALEKAEQVSCSDSSISGSSCECSESCSCCSSGSIRSQRISPPPLPILPPPRQKVKFSNKVTHITLPTQESVITEAAEISPNKVGLPHVEFQPNTFHQRLMLAEASTSSLPDLKPLCLSTKNNSKSMLLWLLLILEINM